MTRNATPRVLIALFAIFLFTGSVLQAGFGGPSRAAEDRRESGSAVDTFEGETGDLGFGDIDKGLEDEPVVDILDEGLEPVPAESRAGGRQRSSGFGGALGAADEVPVETGLTLEELEREKAAQAKMRVTKVSIPSDLLLLYDWSLRFPRIIRPESIWVKRDMVLLQTRAPFNEMYAINRLDGEVLWKVVLTKQVMYPPTVSREAVYAIVDNYIIAIDKIQGRIIWRRQPDFPIAAQPLVIEPTMYIPSWEGKFYALDITRREKIYIKGETEETTYRATEYDLRYRWHLTTKGLIVAPGIEVDKMMYFGSEDGFLYSISGDGELRYQFQTQGKIQASPAATTSTVFVGATDYNLYAVDRLTGDEQWHFPAGGDILQPPIVDSASHLVYVPVRGHGYYALHTFDGHVVWHMKEAKKIAGLSADHAYVLMTGRRLAAVEKETGRVAWISLLSGFAFGIEAHNDWTDESDPLRVYLVDESNVLVSLREQERLYRAKQEDRE